MSFARQVIEAVGNLDFTGHPVDEFVDGACAVLTAALAKLPEAKRDAAIAKIERCLAGSGRAIR
jgi:hypothetical protein